MAVKRPRQNSVVVFATSHFTTSARKVKSAMDLQTLVLREETEESVRRSAETADVGGVGGGLGPALSPPSPPLLLADVHRSPSLASTSAAAAAGDGCSRITSV